MFRQTQKPPKQICLLFLLIFFLLPTLSFADIRKPGGNRSTNLEIHAGFGYHGILGAVGARLSVPLMHNGFIKSLNNAVFLNFGADVYSNFKYLEIGIPVMLHWSFYFNNKWSAFAELGVNVYIGRDLFEGKGFTINPLHWIGLAIGGHYHFSKRIALILRLGNPNTSLGVDISF